MLGAENAITGGGWKTGNHLNFCEDDDFLTVKSLKECLLGKTYSFDQIMNIWIGSFNHTFCLDNHNGLIHYIEPGKGSMKTDVNNSLFFELDPNMNYFLTFLDPKFRFITTNPSVIPKQLIKIGSNSGLIIYYLTVSFLKNDYDCKFITQKPFMHGHLFFRPLDMNFWTEKKIHV